MTKKDFIVKEIINKIQNGYYVSNQKLPTEYQISIKYDVSRIVSQNIFSKLKDLGAVYSIPKKGYYVAEFFSSMFKNIESIFKIEKVISKIISKEINNWYFPKAKKNQFKILRQQMYRDNKLILVSETILTKAIETKITNNIKITDFINNYEGIKTILITSKFEKDKTFNEKLQIVEYWQIYSKNNYCYIQRNVISNKFYFSKREEKGI